MRKLQLSKFEKLLFQIAFNSQEKLISAITLYKSGLSYSSAYFLTVIAEEEMAKLIILPIAKEAGELEKVLTDKDSRKNGYLNHSIKQKIFSSYGLQNRDYKHIEQLKQECLYTGANPDLSLKYKPTKPEMVYEELKHAIKLSLKFILKDSILIVTSLSSDYKDAIYALTTKIFLPCIHSELPELVKEMQTENKQEEKLNKKNDNDLIDLYTNPHLLMDMLKHALGKDYQNFLKEAKFMSYDELITHLEKFL